MQVEFVMAVEQAHLMTVLKVSSGPGSAESVRPESVLSSLSYPIGFVQLVSFSLSCRELEPSLTSPVVRSLQPPAVEHRPELDKCLVSGRKQMVFDAERRETELI